MITRLSDYLGHCQDRGYLALGPFVITTRGRHAAKERNAFEIGVEAEQFGLMKGKAAAF